MLHRKIYVRGVTMKRAVVIFGSPQAAGNAAKLLNIAVKPAEQTGFEISFFHLHDLKRCFSTLPMYGSKMRAKV